MTMDRTQRSWKITTHRPVALSVLSVGRDFTPPPPEVWAMLEIFLVVSAVA